MKLRLAALAALLLVLLNGCAHAPPTRYSATYWDTFDTVITLTGYAASQRAFDGVAEAAHAEFVRLHAIFDRYEAHEGVRGVWLLNQSAGQGPVEVEPELLALLELCLREQPATGGKVNVFLGGALELWHQYRAEGRALPPLEQLQAAAGHASAQSVRVDVQRGTVEITDPALSLDVGAVAKGFATEQVARLVESLGMTSYLINAGGNVRAGSAPEDGRANWRVGVDNPQKAGTLLATLEMSGCSAVTSGVSQRYYEVDGVRYHHLIDPDTLMPGREHLQVTIVTEDSALADLLSTAAFLLPHEESRQLVESLDGVEALWVLPDGSLSQSSGLSDFL